MIPGLLSLFSRSLYRGSAARLRELDPESTEYRHVHEERERFAAAAIAFCLRHDKSFLWHFWRKVCSKKGERKPRTEPKVEVEPRRWSDLLLGWDKVLCAVEIKIGANLDDHQNPAKHAFSKQDGYGYFLSRRSRERECKGRYIVFGWKPETESSHKNTILGLEVQQRKWSHLENSLPLSAMTDDLTALLSGFGIAEFTFRLMKNKKLSGKLGDFGSAVAVLESVRDKLEWPASFRVTARRHELGIYLPAVARKKVIKGLAERLKRENDVPDKDVDVAWFGYLGERAQRCVYAYCSKSRRARLVRRLKASKFVVEEEARDGEDGPYCAVVREGNGKLDDITWFTKALEAAGETDARKG